jgi:SAM-dependent methyltransferase
VHIIYNDRGKFRTMTVFELQSYIESIEHDSVLFQEQNFSRRIEVIDFLEFQFTDLLERLLQKTFQADELNLLKHRAEKVRSLLEEINTELFQKLQARIQAAALTGKAFKNLINEYFDLQSYRTGRRTLPGYDNLDIFINRLFPFQHMPEQTVALEPGMVFYQKTPVRIVFELAERSHFTSRDVFVDLGSGLGQVAILISLITGIAARGIEMEPAFCQYARGCAAWLNLSNVEFVNADARKADYTEGTVFYMYTSFVGEMLGEVLEILRKESLLRKIRIITYGPCTARVALQSWLDFAPLKDDNMYELGFFSSR